MEIVVVGYEIAGGGGGDFYCLCYANKLIQVLCAILFTSNCRN